MTLCTPTRAILTYQHKADRHAAVAGYKTTPVRWNTCPEIDTSNLSPPPPQPPAPPSPLPPPPPSPLPRPLLEPLAVSDQYLKWQRWTRPYNRVIGGIAIRSGLSTVLPWTGLPVNLFLLSYCAVPVVFFGGVSAVFLSGFCRVSAMFLTCFCMCSCCVPVVLPVVFLPCFCSVPTVFLSCSRRVFAVFLSCSCRVFVMFLLSFCRIFAVFLLCLCDVPVVFL